MRITEEEAVCRGGACDVGMERQRWLLSWRTSGGVVGNRLQGSEGHRLYQESELSIKDHKSLWKASGRGGRLQEVHI